MQTPWPQPDVLEAGLDGDVGEGAVAIVLEQVRGRLFAFGEAFQTPSVDQEDVEPAIVVVVVEGDAAAGGLEQIFVLVLAAEDGFGVEAGFFGDIDKAQPEVRRSFLVGWLARCTLGQKSPRPSHGQNIFKRQDQRGSAQGAQKRTSGGAQIAGTFLDGHVLEFAPTLLRCAPPLQVGRRSSASELYAVAVC